MRHKQFKKIVSSLEVLNTKQFRELKACIKIIEDNEPCSILLKNNYLHIECPHCSHTHIQRWGKQNGLQRYRCKSCKKTFNSLSSTPLANLRKKEIVHFKNVNAYHSRLKKWINRFNSIATKYLESYLSWFRKLNEFNMKTVPEIILLRAKQGGTYKHQPLTMT